MKTPPVEQDWIGHCEISITRGFSEELIQTPNIYQTYPDHPIDTSQLQGSLSSSADQTPL